MCGLAGLIFGRKRRQERERHALVEIALRLLQLNESRGPHATGLATINTSGLHDLVKLPLTASEFLNRHEPRPLLRGIDNRTTILMGHTRWRTRGSETNPRNNHPIRAGNVIGTHNGTITNADMLFERFGFDRQSEVDSELLVRSMDACWPAGELHLTLFVNLLQSFEGQMSAVFSSRRDPGRIVVLKGNKPLGLRFNPNARAILYSSLEEHLDEALEDEPDWEPLRLPPMSVAVFRVEGLEGYHTDWIQFKARGRQAAY